MRRSGIARFGSVAALQQLMKRFWRAQTVANFYERADDRTHHVAQERRRFDGKNH
jgi:hypothetical protein